MASRKSDSAGYSAYRPLNVRDALSYLDQVKIQFIGEPEVYNRFLDVMKEFKGQIIDTPGVIDRVSTLFRGHPVLIQGFNTFLPPGYHIDCTKGEGGDQLITVTTPSGTVSQVAGQLAVTLDRQDKENKEKARKAAEQEAKPDPLRQGAKPAAAQPAPATAAANRAAPRPRAGAAEVRPPNVTIPPQSQPTAPSGPSTPSAAQFLASGGLGGAAQAKAGTLPQGLEFNHAISFVNKIKNRFNSEPETYKQFLEILQTYQRDTRDISDVYEQVSKLFGGSPDLVDEFKQFLPEIGHGGLSGMPFGHFVQAASGGAPPVDKPGAKRTKDAKEAGPAKKRRGGAAADGRGGQKKKTNAARADSPSGEDESSSAFATGGIQTLASPDEVAFFDKVKKFIDDKVTYHEFLKLINLFVQDMIDTKTLVERAETFIGGSGDVWAMFRKIVGADDAGNTGPHPTSAQGGYGFGGMISVDSQVVENTPMLERNKPYLDGPRVKAFGPSYRKLPKSEINVVCTGRDAMCWDVLNDEWVSHPTWAAEDAAPFMAHKKNAYEEALHKSEEERHEYDYHIEANLRTIALLEPLNNKIQTMDPEDRVHFNLKNGLGGQSRSIYQRIVKKVYGKELGPEIIRAMHDNPVVALPIVIERLKAKDEEWKKAQREWNRVWREQDAKNFYKALDHQGVAFKSSDKKVISAKALVSEIEARRREHDNLRATLLDKRPWRPKPQFNFTFADVEVVKDVLKLVISYLDRINNQVSTADKDRVEHHLRDLVPLLFIYDKEEFDAEFGDVEHESPDGGSDESDGDVSMADDDDTASVAAQKKKGKGAPAGDLRKKLLKQAGEKEGREKRGSTMTPGPDDEAQTERRSIEGTPVTDDRGETPLPVPADPEAVAEAVEKDKAVADQSEQTWVNIDAPEPPRPAAEVSQAPQEIKPVVTRRAIFFANNHYYVLIRLIEILYTRLKKCKDIADELAKSEKKPINPTAIRLGLAEPDTNYYGIESGENPAQFYYQHLLGMAERLFENEIDAATFEETLRLMFGTKAYIMFTLDRVVAAIVKQVQLVLGDMKSSELFGLLQRDREAETTSTRQQIAYRMQAEALLGNEESLFKIEYHHASKDLTVQLLGREEPTIDDAETTQDKWRQYIESYVLTHPTEGLPSKSDKPFLNRTLADLPDDDAFQSTSGLEIKIALGNYRIFYTPGTEDFFYRPQSSTPAQKAEAEVQEQTDREEGLKKLEGFIESKLGFKNDSTSAGEKMDVDAPSSTTAAPKSPPVTSIPAAPMV